jgi:hypothetical protein
MRQRDFVERYGDPGEDEFSGKGGTIPQRLLMMNGDLVTDLTQEQVFNAATRIAWLAPDDPTAIETAYLVVFTRRPAADEASYFAQSLAGCRSAERTQRIADMYWALLNSSEYSWNH